MHKTWATTLLLAGVVALSAAAAPRVQAQSAPQIKGWLHDALRQTRFDFDAIAQTARTDKARAALRGCRKGSAKACYELGDKVHGGDGIKRDNHLAVALIAYACHGDYQRACYDIGVRFHLGVVVPQNFRTSRVYFQKACTAGLAVACHMLAVDARDGLGVDVDTQYADSYFERACTLGYQPDCARAPAQHRVGRNERQLPADAPRDLVTHARACDAGLMSGCVALARAYQQGDGVAQNPQRAYDLYETACDWGNLDACAQYRDMQP